MSEALLILAVLLPVALGLLLLLWDGARRFAPWAALPALGAAMLPSAGALHLSWLLLGSEWGIDGTGRLFLLFTALLWLGGGWYARGYVSEGRRRFFVFFLLAMGGNMGLIVAQDTVGFYLFFAMMSFASYGLVVHERSPDAMRAGRVYILLVVAGEVLLFAALAIAAYTGGAIGFEAAQAAVAHSSHRDLLLFLQVSGLGIKVGLIGLHVWLPLAHPVAPTPASAVLSGAMVNAGLLGWLRLLPLGDIALPGWGGALMALGALTAFYGVAAGLTQRDPKVVLAYSSISQMGVMTIGIGAGLAAPEAWPALLVAVTLYALHHGLAKGALFLGVGLAKGAVGPGRHWIGIGLLLPAMALAGAPLTGGMLAKDMLKAALPMAPPWPGIAALLPWSALATALLMSRFLYLVWPRGAEEKAATTGRVSMLAGWLPVLTAAGVLPWLLLPPGSTTLVLSRLLDALWPIAAAAAIAVAARRSAARLPLLPPGDILLPAELLACMLTRAAATRLDSPSLSALAARLLPLVLLGHKWTWFLTAAEAGMGSWPVAVGLCALLAIVSALLFFL